MKQILYSSLLETSGSLTMQNVILNFVAAAVLSLLIYTSYRLSHSGAVYSRKFNVSLIMMTLITTLVMCVIGNNIALSLGMVGALSIVRFRTAIKDSRDTAYIFWAIAVGITCGVSDYLIAGIGTVVIFVFLIIFGAVKNNDRIVLVIKAEADKAEELSKQVTAFFAGDEIMKVQNVNSERNQAELIYEVSEKTLKSNEDKNGNFITSFSSKEGVKNVSLIRQDEEINQ